MKIKSLEAIKKMLIGSENSFDDFPENVQIAVDWWLDCLTADNKKENIIISDDEKNQFKMSLAHDIKKKMKLHGRCCICVDYNPCEMLAKAGRFIGKTNMLFDYPWETKMDITEDKIVVRSGHEDNYEEIWNKECQIVLIKKSGCIR